MNLSLFISFFIPFLYILFAILFEKRAVSFRSFFYIFALFFYSIAAFVQFFEPIGEYTVNKQTFFEINLILFLCYILYDLVYFNIFSVNKKTAMPDSTYSSLKLSTGSICFLLILLTVLGISTAWGSILNFSNLKELWVASDCGFKCNFHMQQLHRNNCKIKLIEEGVGNYVPSLIGIFSNSHIRPLFLRNFVELLKDLLRVFSGSGSRLNNSKWIDEIYLYHPDYPLLPCKFPKKLRQIPLSPKENFISIVQYFDFSNHPWLDTLKNQKVLIYATNWFDDSSFTQDDLKEYDFLITKYHPHLKDKINKQEGKNIYMTGNLPIEVLIFKLLSQDCTITLRSAFSSSMFYLLETPIKLEFADDNIPDFLVNYYNYLISKQK